MNSKISSFLCCTLLIAGCSGHDDVPSGKIVSINPCTDAILMELADADQIGAISHFSHDVASSSVDVDKALKYPAIGQSTEEIIALKPSLVLTGGHMSAAASAAFDRLNITVLKTPVANSIAESHEQIRTIAKAINQEQRGEELVASIGIALSKAAPKNEHIISAIIWQGGGLVPGKDTLINEIMLSSGFANGASQYGLAQWDILGLERLSSNPPELILRGGGASDPMLQHPIMDEVDSKIVSFPQSMIWCAGPTISKAAKMLAHIRKDYIAP